MTMRTVAVLLAVPLVAIADAGTIIGTVEKPDAVKAVAAVLRDDPPVTYPGKLDPKSGQFAVPGLPLDKNYDLTIDLASGARLEGVNLKVKPTDFKDGDPPLIKADEAKLKEITKGLSKFEDVHEFLAVGGNAQHAAVVVNKLRTKPFYESKPGEVVWRLEVWFFEREELDDAWVKEQDTLFVIHYRERLPKADYDKKAITLDPRLGGLKPTAKDAKIDVGKIELPDDKPGVRLRNGPVNPEKRGE
jgi:hypothetical protein